MNKLADAVRVTLDPRAARRLDKKWELHDHNDGVSIAKDIDLEDPFERIGAELVKEVAKKTDEVAGDGTTTATCSPGDGSRGLKNVAAGANRCRSRRASRPRGSCRRVAARTRQAG